MSTYLDFLGLSAAAFEWADSYDSKDWDRLRKCIAPTLRVSWPAFAGSLTTLRFCLGSAAFTTVTFLLTRNRSTTVRSLVSSGRRCRRRSSSP